MSAVAIDNALQFAELQQRRREAEQIEEIGRALTSELDPKEVLGKVVAAVLDVLDVDGASVWLCEGPGGSTGRIAEADGAVTLPVGLTWTLDGEQLNNVTFFGGIEPGSPLIKERDRKNKPLPDFNRQTLLPEIPELLERTYRADRDIGTFSVLSVAPARFLAQDGVEFAYSYVDADNLTRLGLARAVIVQGDLFMMLYEAPRLHYYERNLPDFMALLESASLPG